MILPCFAFFITIRPRLSRRLTSGAWQRPRRICPDNSSKETNNVNQVNRFLGTALTATVMSLMGTMPVSAQDRTRGDPS